MLTPFRHKYSSAVRRIFDLPEVLGDFVLKALPSYRRFALKLLICLLLVARNGANQTILNQYNASRQVHAVRGGLVGGTKLGTGETSQRLANHGLSTFGTRGGCAGVFHSGIHIPLQNLV